MTLPLGVDIGRARVRIALTSVRAGVPDLEAVAARDHDGDIGSALGSALDELQTSERRCVLGLGSPDAHLHLLDLPPMPMWERRRAATFEAAHLIDYPVGDAMLSLVAVRGTERWCLGIAHKPAIAAVLAATRRAGLRTIAIDDTALALQRALPMSTCIVDMGLSSTRVTIFGGPIPHTTSIPIAGDHFTYAIARSLGIDRSLAEHRKRQTGFGGAGESERDTLAGAIAEILIDTPVLRPGSAGIALCGNGSRVAGMSAALGAALGVTVVPAQLDADRSSVMPPDVLRAAGMDWSTAYGLSLWDCAS